MNELREIEPEVRILHGVTWAPSLNITRGQSKYLRESGYQTYLVSSPGPDLDRIAEREGARAIGIPMERGIAPIRDLLALFRLVWQILQIRPALTNFGTPKAGLLGGIAAYLCGVPCRVYTLFGLRAETSSGFRRTVLLACEWVACRTAHRVICVSESLRQRVIALSLVTPDKAVLFGPGSCNGVDASRFEPTEHALREGRRLRERLGISDKAPVIGFVGRMVRDKGIAELLDACTQLRGEFPDLRLLILGGTEKEDALPDEVLARLKAAPFVICLGFDWEPAPYYHIMDIFTLPSYREGFPITVLEAHAAGRPVVGFRSTGIIDAVIDGATGLLVETGNVGALVKALSLLLRDRDLAFRLGQAGRERVLREFGQERIWSSLREEYSRLLGQAKGIVKNKDPEKRSLPAVD